MKIRPVQRCCEEHSAVAIRTFSWKTDPCVSRVSDREVKVIRQRLPRPSVSGGKFKILKRSGITFRDRVAV
jgi:hypothetical protein